MATMTYDDTRAAGGEGLRAPRGLRLTRRGRFVVILASLAVAFVALTLSHVGTAGASAGDRSTATVVRSGDTLWSIATRVAPDRDPRVVVEQIKALNHLGAASVHPGQALVLPG